MARSRVAVLCSICVLWIAAFLVAWPTQAPAQTAGVNLLSGRLPVNASGVARAERMTDGVAAVRGDHWKTDRTAIFRSNTAFVEFDLGEELPITYGYLLGDNNDTYTLTISSDGASFAPLWEAVPTGGSGLQPRLTDSLNATGRYIRITAKGGDASYSISEVQLFGEKPDPWPPAIAERPGIPPDERMRNLTLSFGFSLAAFALLAYSGAPIWWTLLALLIPIFGGWELVGAMQDDWPVAQREIALLRGTMAMTALVAVLREAFAPKRFLANGGAILAVLGVCATISVAAFFNLGRPQYIDHKLNEPSFVHNFDMRVYYPVGKYFKELRFDGLYMASVAAYADDDPSVTLESLAHVQLRDLKTHRMTSVAQVSDEIQAVKARFSEERWQQFIVDMRYFRENMGVRDYLGSMHDHGGNATPVWFTLAHYIFKSTTASNETLFVAAMLDPLLLLLAFLAIGRTFGARTMLVSMVLWGANDFYMFGTNWAGATLRHDWMAYLAFGLCALRKEHWVLGGVFLAASAMIRAFPAMALIALSIPVFYWLSAYVQEHKRLPRLGEFARAQAPFLRVALGATVTVAVLFLISSLVLSFDAWSEWLHKVSLLNKDPHVNHVSWRGLIGGPDGVHNRLLRGRLPVYIGGIAFYLGLVILAAKRRSFAAIATLGLIGIPLAFHPANYYIHFIFLMPLIAVERKVRGARPIAFGDALMWGAFLFVCGAQYWTTRESDLGLHFHFASALLFVGITVGLLALLLQDTMQERGVLALLEPELAVAAAGSATALGNAEIAGELEPDPAPSPDGASGTDASPDSEAEASTAPSAAQAGADANVDAATGDSAVVGTAPTGAEADVDTVADAPAEAVADAQPDAQSSTPPKSDA